MASGTADACRPLIGLPHLELPENYAKVEALLDVTEFIDYTLLHFCVGHQDWGFSKNWYAIIRPRVDGPEGRFRFVPWAGENILLDESINRVRPNGEFGGLPGDLHPQLMANAEYRRAFAERVQLHLLTPGGALTKEANIARWIKWQAVLDQPIVAESARWGDYRRDVHHALTGSYASTPARTSGSPRTGPSSTPTSPTAATSSSPSCGRPDSPRSPVPSQPDGGRTPLAPDGTPAGQREAA